MVKLVPQEQILGTRSYPSRELLVRTNGELRQILTLVLRGHNTQP